MDIKTRPLLEGLQSYAFIALVSLVLVQLQYQTSVLFIKHANLSHYMHSLFNDLNCYLFNFALKSCYKPNCKIIESPYYSSYRN